MISAETSILLDAFNFDLVSPDKRQKDYSIYMASTPTQDVVISLPDNACKNDLLEAIFAAGQTKQREKIRDAHQAWLNTFKG
jgi:hypothetical protein